MHITVDGSENGAELYHLSVLFQSLAKARGFVAPVELKDVMSVKINATPEQTEALREALKAGKHGELMVLPADSDAVAQPPVTVSVSEPVRAPADMTDTEHFQTCVDAGTVTFVEPPATDVVSNLDSAGLPWDARIHAGSRERNTDGSWRVRRKPKDTDQDEWNATLARVTSELRDLMEIPVSSGAALDALAETREIGDLTPEEIAAFVNLVDGVTPDSTIKVSDHVEVSIAPPVVVAPPVITPPVIAVAPPIPAIETFAQVMVWLTGHTPKDEAAKPAMVARVNEILASNGLTVLTQLGQRPDLIPQVMSQFIEAFGS